MRKTLMFVAIIMAMISFILAYNAGSAHAEDTAGKTVTLTFDENDFTFSKDGPYDLIEYAGEAATGGKWSRVAIPGAPQTSVRFVSVLVPPDAVDVKAEVSIENKTLAGTFRLKPAPRVRAISDTGPAPAAPGEDASIYGDASPWPKSSGRLVSVDSIRGFRVATVAVYPMRYVPVKGRIELSSSATVKVTWRYSSSRVYASERNLSRFEDRAKSRVVNPEDSAIFRPLTTLPAMSPTNSNDVDLLIITKSTLADGFADLVEWRTAQGVPAEVVTDWSSYAGSDQQEKIRNLIKDYVLSKGTMYVLLGGDDTIIPDRDCYVLVQDTECADMPTDLYYSCLDGDWNDDGDDLYGEAEDAVDLSPDVYVGRAGVRTRSQAENFCDKVVGYEKNAPQASYVKEYLIGGVELWETYDTVPGHPHSPVSDCEGKCQNLYFQAIAPYWSAMSYRFFDTKTDFDSSAPGDYDVTYYNLITRISEGYSHFFFATHGSKTLWSTEGYYGYFDTTDAELTTNHGRESVIYTIACLTNHFDGNTDPCPGEAFMRNTSGGAVAYMGCSRYNWGVHGTEIDNDPAFSYASAYYQAMFDEDLPTVGRIFARHKEIMAPDVSARESFRWIMYGMNLLGDPAMPVYTENPSTFSVSHPSEMETDGGAMNVDAGVEGARACVSKGSEFYEYAVTDSSGIFSTTLPALTEGQLRIVVTKQNYRPYDAVIPVNPPGGPDPVTNPVPANGAADVLEASALSWDCSAETSHYMVYFGDDPDPAFAGNVSDASFAPAMTRETTYYWRVDPVGTNALVTRGDTWSFRTRSFTSPPEEIIDVFPAHNDEDVPLMNFEVSWKRPARAKWYKVYFGASSPPEFRATTTDNSWSPGTMNYMKRYFWRVEACNSAGNTSTGTMSFISEYEPGDDWDPWDNFLISGTVLQPSATPQTHGPHMLIGSDDADCFVLQMDAGKTYRFQSLNASGSFRYSLYSDLNRMNVLSRNSQPTFDLQWVCAQSGTYYLAVERTDFGDNFTYDLGYSVSTVAAVPAQASDPVPADGANAVSVGASLGWNKAALATSYRIYLGKTTNPQYAGETTALSWTPGTLEYGTTYYWRVDSKNYFTATTGRTWTFRTVDYIAPDAWDPTDDVPAGGTVLSPSENSSTHGPHAFNGFDHADCFRVQMTAGYKYHFSSSSTGDTRAALYMDASAASPIVSDDDSGSGYNFSLGYAAMDNATCYLVVRPYEAGDNTTYDLIYYATHHQATPEKPGNPYPFNNTFDVPVNVTMSWAEAENASRYDVYLGTSSSPPLAASGVGATSWNPGLLEPSTTYYWRVDSVGAWGTATGDSWRFTTGEDYPADAWDPADDSPSGATLLNSSEAMSSHGPHVISCIDNNDYFRIHLVRGCVYSFDSVGGTGDPYVEIYSDSACTKLVASNDDGYIKQFRLDFTPPESGYYYLMVSATLNTYNETMSYALNSRPRTDLLSGINNPANFTAEVVDGNVNLEWNESPSLGVTGYRLYVEGGSGYGTALDIGNATSFSYSDGSPGTDYVFKLTAYNNFSSESPGVLASTEIPGSTKKNKSSSGGCAMGEPGGGNPLLPFLLMLFLWIIARKRVQ